jgi:hypothetical protein
MRHKVRDGVWNIARKQAQGEQFLRMAGVADVAGARTLWQDPSTPVHTRCLAARAIGLLSKHGPKWTVEGVDDDESPLGRARWHGSRDANQRRASEHRSREKEQAIGNMRQLGAESLAEVIRILRDRSETLERREAAASVLGNFKRREAVEALIQVLAEGQEKLSWMCMWALTAIGSRRHARKWT